MKRRQFISNINRAGGLILIGADRFSGLDTNTLRGKEEEIRGAEVLPYNGKPTLFVNGTPYFPTAFISYYPAQYRYGDMRKSGIQFFSLSLTLGDRFVAAYRMGKVRLDRKGIWDSTEQIDFGSVDSRINEILEAAPDAFIFPRIFCDSPSWWDSFHPGEVSRTSDGMPLRQSFSSQVWREETAGVIRKIIRHFSMASYSDRIIGIHVTAGETEESVHHDWLGPVDYSLAARRKFRAWLVRKYKNETGVYKAFEKNVDEIEIPSPREREPQGSGDFHDPVGSRLAMDYNCFKCEEIVETLDFFCKVVKEESRGKLLTGVFYGYTLVEWRDHLALSQLLKSPHIDFLSNTNGGGRNTVIGQHDMHFLSETDSIQKANKLFYYEADTRTCMSRWISELRPEIDPYHEYDLDNWLGPETIEGTIELLKAVFSRVICTGSAHWWFDLWGGWYDHDKIRDLFSAMQKIGDQSLHLPRSSVAEICVLVDEKSLLYYATAKRKTTWIRQQMLEIGRIGAPYDIFLLSDFNDLDLARYKTVIFLNALVLSEREREVIREKYMSANRVLLWLYAPGIIGDTISAENVSALMGMRTASIERADRSEITITLADKKLTYTGNELSPFLYIENGADKIYGVTEDGDAVIGEKRGETYTHVLASVPPLPWQAIQYFIKRSGVHLYSERGDVVYANQSYFSISTAKAGKTTISFPGDCLVEEVLHTGEGYSGRGKTHEVYLSEHSCKLFRIS